MSSEAPGAVGPTSPPGAFELGRARGLLAGPAAGDGGGDVLDEPARDETPPDPFDGLAAIGPLHSERVAREWALVLQSMSVWHVLRVTGAGWYLLVRQVDGARAQTAIDRYVLENRDWPPRRVRERPRFPASPLAMLAFLALGAFFLATGPVAGGARWFARGSSIAGLVTSSEPWRAVTALTLHADSVHVLGNVISGTVFASAVQRRLGPGGAALAVVLSGIGGNVANAFWHRAMGDAGHGSIGASTAVFGAIGILAATQMWADSGGGAHPTAASRWIAAIAPLGGGLALLGALGASPRADLGAHAFGFLAGVVVGLAAVLPMRRKAASEAASRWVHALQAALGALALGLVVGAWHLALRR